MKYRGFQSASDRRWQQRYESILLRKENSVEQANARKQRRKDRQSSSVVHTLDLTKIIGKEVAVVCTSLSQIKSINDAAKRYNSCFIYSFDDYDMNRLWDRHAPNVAITIEDDWFGYRIKGYRESQLFSYQFIDFYELMPVKDLGQICVNQDGISTLFE